MTDGNNQLLKCFVLVIKREKKKDLKKEDRKTLRKKIER